MRKQLDDIQELTVPDPTADDQALLLQQIRFEIEQLTPERRAHVHRIARAIREAVTAQPSEGMLALALVGAEHSVDG